jgi:thiamine kinase-like enzyme
MVELDQNSALQYIKQQILSWHEVTSETSAFTLLTGTSNKVYKVQTSLLVVPQVIIFRVFGPNEITDKVRERRIFNALSSQNLSAKNLSESQSWRLEEYLENYLPMTTPDYFSPDNIQQISQKFKAFHNIDMSNIVEIDENILENNIEKWRNIGRKKVSLLKNQDYINILNELLSDESLNKCQNLIPRNSPIVFCHLDPSSFNLLYNRKLQDFFLIDYEFSGYWYRAIDFALMFTEIKIDYEVQEPPYFKYYPEKQVSDEVIKRYVLEYGEGAEMWVEVKMLLILGQYIWGVWDLAMWNDQKTGFDYIENAVMRLREFTKDYDEFVEKGGRDYLVRVSERLF